jgi:hypothetical protein
MLFALDRLGLSNTLHEQLKPFLQGISQRRKAGSALFHFINTPGLSKFQKSSGLLASYKVWLFTV